MLKSEDHDKLHKTLLAIEKNFVRLDYAYHQIADLLPLSLQTYETVEDTAISYVQLPQTNNRLTLPRRLSAERRGRRAIQRFHNVV